MKLHTDFRKKDTTPPYISREVLIFAIQTYFNPDKTNSSFATNKDLLEYLEKETHNKINRTQLGRVMAFLGFTGATKKINNVTQRGYYLTMTK